MESIYSRPVQTPNTIPVTPPAPAGIEPKVYVPVGGADMPPAPRPTGHSIARTSPVAWILLSTVVIIGAGFFAWRSGLIELPESLRFIDTDVPMPEVYPVTPFAERRPEVIETYLAVEAALVASTTATSTATTTVSSTTSSTSVVPPATTTPNM